MPYRTGTLLEATRDYLLPIRYTVPGVRQAHVQKYRSIGACKYNSYNLFPDNDLNLVWKCPLRTLSSLVEALVGTIAMAGRIHRTVTARREIIYFRGGPFTPK